MLLKELFEAESKHATFCFGRMNPPTIGHEQVFKTMEAQGGDYFIFVSQSQDKKENPLGYSEKIKFIKAIHEKYADHVIEDSSINTVVKAASYLYDQGYTDATFVAGSDRIEQFKKLLTQYNGVEGKAHGYYKFNVLDFASSGEREDGAEGVAGVSASGARLAAANNDLEAFEKATGAGQYAKPMFDAVRQGMGISENLKIDELSGEEDYYKFILAKLKTGRPLTTREKEFYKTYRLMHKTEDVDMRAHELEEHQKNRKAKTYNLKPRNPVAHAAQTTISGSGAHKDKKKAQKQGDVKHKGKVDERVRDPEDWDEGNTEPPNNMAIYINGKKWKVFPGRGTYADDDREMKQYYDLQAWARKKSEATGKKWEVYRTGEPATP